jgi:hypothetical protein
MRMQLVSTKHLLSVQHLIGPQSTHPESNAHQTLKTAHYSDWLFNGWNCYHSYSHKNSHCLLRLLWDLLRGQREGEVPRTPKDPSLRQLWMKYPSLVLLPPSSSPPSILLEQGWQQALLGPSLLFLAQGIRASILIKIKIPTFCLSSEQIRATWHSLEKTALPARSGSRLLPRMVWYV